jgi:hypothetical protein
LGQSLEGSWARLRDFDGSRASLPFSRVSLLLWLSLWVSQACSPLELQAANSQTSILVPETYAPTLLRKRAAKLSKVTGKYYRAPMDAERELNIGQLFKTQLSRPWQLLFQEPLVMIISIYMAIVYVSVARCLAFPF